MSTRSDWDQFFDEARNADILAAARDLGAQLKRSTSAEYEGPCPLCGGTDRFSVNIVKRVYNCRGSTNAKGKPGGDVIDMVMHVTGCSFIEACERLTGRARPDRSRDETVEERLERQRAYEKRKAQMREREEAERRSQAARARLDEQAIQAVLERAMDLDDPRAAHGRLYLERERRLKPPKRLLIDIKFVLDLDYWGMPNDVSDDPVKLAALPAIVAIIREPHGAMIGLAQTYLDPVEPKKWEPIGSVRNSAKKVRGDKKGGMIRLGRIGETLAIGEGWENLLAWDELRRRGSFGDVIAGEDVALAAAVDLGNLAGRSTGGVPHQFLKDNDGKPLRISNGLPDPGAPGVIIPEGVRTIIPIMDRDSELHATSAMMLCAGRRWRATGFDLPYVAVPDKGTDYNTMLIRMELAHAG